MQKIMDIYRSYKQVPRLLKVSSSSKEDTLLNEQEFLADSSIPNLCKLIFEDDSITNRKAETLLFQIVYISMSEYQNDKLTLLEKPETIAFEDLKRGDIYITSYSNVHVFIDYEQSALVDFKTSTIKEHFAFNAKRVDTLDSNLTLFGRIDI